jgi:hypothetical protein
MKERHNVFVRCPQNQQLISKDLEIKGRNGKNSTTELLNDALEQFE